MASSSRHREKQVRLTGFDNEPMARLAEQRLRQIDIPCFIRCLRGGPGLWGSAYNLPHDLFVYESDEPQARFRFASWNIRVFSHRNRDASELLKIGKIRVNYDRIAIIELRDEAVVGQTETVLGSMSKGGIWQEMPLLESQIKSPGS